MHRASFSFYGFLTKFFDDFTNIGPRKIILGVNGNEVDLGWPSYLALQKSIYKLFVVESPSNLFFVRAAYNMQYFI